MTAGDCTVWRGWRRTRPAECRSQLRTPLCCQWGGGRVGPHAAWISDGGGDRGSGDWCRPWRDGVSCVVRRCSASRPSPHPARRASGNVICLSWTGQRPWQPVGPLSGGKGTRPAWWGLLQPCPIWDGTATGRSGWNGARGSWRDWQRSWPTIILLLMHKYIC